MASGTSVKKITAIVNSSVANQVKLAQKLRENGLHSISITSGRTTVLEARTGPLAFLYKDAALSSNPGDIYSFLIEEDLAERAMTFISQTAHLQQPGRGTIYSENVTLLKTHELCLEHRAFSAGNGRETFYPDLMAITCIVQRGQGDQIARIALDTGTCVPAVYFGIGTGLRDKLGLLRITIPPEKEVINVVASAFDGEEVMELMIDAGRLDQPGRGFIYFSRLQQGLVDTKVSAGQSRQAASVEQIIAVIDEMKGGVEWRRKGISGGGSKAKRAYLKDLVDLTLVCDEGRAQDLVVAAMQAGAAGATISKHKLAGTQTGQGKVSPARESSSMIVAEGQIDALLSVLEKAGAFDDRSHGQVFYRPVPKACTYLAKKS